MLVVRFPREMAKRSAVLMPEITQIATCFSAAASLSLAKAINIKKLVRATAAPDGRGRGLNAIANVYVGSDYFGIIY